MSAKLVLEITGPYADDFIEYLKQTSGDSDMTDLYEDISYDMCCKIGIDTEEGPNALSHWAHQIKYIKSDGSILGGD